MVNFTNFTRNAAAAVGALVLSTTFVTAAVGPAATAAGSLETAQAQVTVQEQQA